MSKYVYFCVQQNYRMRGPSECEIGAKTIRNAFTHGYLPCEQIIKDWNKRPRYTIKVTDGIREDGERLRIDTDSLVSWEPEAVAECRKFMDVFWTAVDVTAARCEPQFPHVVVKRPEFAGKREWWSATRDPLPLVSRSD